jgi:hypothetical protein
MIETLEDFISMREVQDERQERRLDEKRTSGCDVKRYSKAFKQ